MTSRQSKAPCRISALMLVILTVSGCASQSHTSDRAESPLNGLAWLAGSWKSEEAGQCSEEHWMQPAGETMLGVSRTVSNGTTTFFEFLRIESHPDGVFYLASPKGRQPPTPFKLVTLQDEQVVFANPEHDFPQRIVYRRQGNELHGRIEGIDQSRPRSEEWTWRRVRE